MHDQMTEFSEKPLSAAKQAQLRVATKNAVAANRNYAIERRKAYNASPNLCLACQAPILVSLDDMRGYVFQQVKVKRFCNQSCAARYNNFLSTSPRNKPKLRVCSMCHDEYTRPQGGTAVRCRKCMGIVLSLLPTKTKSECIVEDIRRHARTILRRLGHRTCQICAYKHRVDCCHIKPIKAFLPTALVSEINAVKNLAALCPNHHVELDLGLLTL